MSAKLQRKRRIGRKKTSHKLALKNPYSVLVSEASEPL